MDKELPPFEFGVSRILDCGFMIEEAIAPDENGLTIGYGMNFLFDVEESWIQYIIRADFKQSNSEQVFITGSVLTRFSIMNLSQFVDEDNKIVFPSDSLEALFGIAFGHLRAILAKNLSGSRFGHLYIPIVHSGPLFNDLLQININQVKEKMEKEGIVFQKQEQKRDIEEIVLAPNTIEEKSQTKGKI